MLTEIELHDIQHYGYASGFGTCKSFNKKSEKTIAKEDTKEWIESMKMDGQKWAEHLAKEKVLQTREHINLY